MSRCDENELHENAIYQILLSIFPERNDFFPCDYVEELQELNHFGINTREKLKRMLARHHDKILEIDASPMDEWHQNYYCNEYPDEPIKERIQNGYWFAFPGLLRLALELEFGDEYEKYTNKRDGI